MEMQYITEGDVAIIRLNAPEKLNAIGPVGALGLTQLLERAECEARAVLIGAVGRAFCAGADLSGGGTEDRLKPGTPDYDAGGPLDTHYNPLILKMRDLNIPILTEIRGAAAGIGCSIALMGDIIVASEDAYFLQAFCNIGLVPDGNSSYLLARSIGRTRAMEMMLLGERLNADQALSYGLVNRVVPNDQLESTSLALAMRLASGPTKSLAVIRKQAWAGLDHSFDEHLSFERSQQKIAGMTRDHAEGVSAFLEKRKSIFTGQ